MAAHVALPFKPRRSTSHGAAGGARRVAYTRPTPARWPCNVKEISCPLNMTAHAALFLKPRRSTSCGAAGGSRRAVYACSPVCGDGRVAYIRTPTACWLQDASPGQTPTTSVGAVLECPRVSSPTSGQGAVRIAPAPEMMPCTSYYDFIALQCDKIEIAVDSLPVDKPHLKPRAAPFSRKVQAVRPSQIKACFRFAQLDAAVAKAERRWV